MWLLATNKNAHYVESAGSIYAWIDERVAQGASLGRYGSRRGLILGIIILRSAISD